jgi:hypothetical protein
MLLINGNSEMSIGKEVALHQRASVSDRSDCGVVSISYSGPSIFQNTMSEIL